MLFLFISTDQICVVVYLYFLFSFFDARTKQEKKEGDENIFVLIVCTTKMIIILKHHDRYISIYIFICIFNKNNTFIWVQQRYPFCVLTHENPSSLLLKVSLGDQVVRFRSKFESGQRRCGAEEQNRRGMIK